jgi:hypothetical protein
MHEYEIEYNIETELYEIELIVNGNPIQTVFTSNTARKATRMLQKLRNRTRTKERKTTREYKRAKYNDVV